MHCQFIGLPDVAHVEELTRTWKDKSGAFSLEARLLKQTKRSVSLLKQDGLVVEVPISALSELDKKYLRDRNAPDDNPFAGGVPQMPKVDRGSASQSAIGRGQGIKLLIGSVNPVELPTDGAAIDLSDDSSAVAVSPDPIYVQPEFRAFVTTLEKLDAYARTSRPVLVDPEGPVFAASTHRVGNAVDPKTFGRLYLIDSRRKNPRTVIDVEETFLLFDHHIASGYSLAMFGVDSPSERGGDLIVMANLATGKPDVIARWRLPDWDRPGFKPKVEFARLLDQNRAVVQVNDSIYIWTLDQGKCLHKIDGIRAGAVPATSATGKMLAVPESGGAKLVDLATGELLGKVPFQSVLTPEVHFSENGKSLALVAGNQFIVWNLVDAMISAEATFDKPSGKFFGWIDDTRLLTQLAGLIDVELGMSLWSYYLPSIDHVVTLPGGIVVIDKTQEASLIGLNVPHGPVQTVAEKLAKGDAKLMLLHPGSKVSLKIEAIDRVDRSEIESGLKAAVERAGWEVDPSASVQVIATIGRGKTETLRFRTLGSSIRSEGETVNIKPFTASLEIRDGSKVLWSRSSSNMVPRLVRLEKGETLKQAVKRYEKPDPSYFERLTIPPKILRPEVTKQIGRSRIVNGEWKE
ncbi:MAG: SHD1 domain-containing protein [Pirellulaceae bacterium]